MRAALHIIVTLLVAALLAPDLGAAPQVKSGGGGQGGKIGERVPPPPDPPDGGGGGIPGGSGTGAGGTYRGPVSPGAGGNQGPPIPGGTPAAAPTAPGPQAPGVPTPRALVAAQDRSEWWHWWDFHRELFLDLDQTLARLSPFTPGGDGVPESLTGRRKGLSWEAVYGRVVPEIVAALAEVDDPRFVRQALLALGRIGEAPPPTEGVAGSLELASVLSSYLADRRLAVTEAAVVALGALASPQSTVMLNELLLDTEQGRELCGRRRVPVRMRALAAYGLGVSGGAGAPVAVRRYAVHSLAKVLDSDVAAYPDVQAACVIALGLIPTGPGPAGDGGGPLPPSTSLEAQVRHLLAMFRDHDQKQMVRNHAPTALARLLAFDRELDPKLRAEVVKTLLDAQSKRSREQLGVRRSCVVALGEIGDADNDALDVQIRERLEETVKKGDIPSRGFAMIGLARIGSRAGKGSGKDAEPLAAMRDVETFLVRQLVKGSNQIQPWASLSLGVLGYGLRQHGELLSNDTADALRGAIEETKSPEQCAAHCMGIGLVGDNRGRAAVIERLESFKEERSRALVAVALGLLRDRRASEPLKELMNDSLHRPDLMEAAALGRALVGDRTLVEELITRLGDCDDEVSSLGVCRGLAWSGDHRALAALLALLKDTEKSAGMRANAAEALGRIADRSTIPWDVRISAGLNYLDAPTTLTDPTGFGILDTF